MRGSTQVRTGVSRFKALRPRPLDDRTTSTQSGDRTHAVFDNQRILSPPPSPLGHLCFLQGVSSLPDNTMIARKPIHLMNAYLRSIRPRDHLAFDRLVRLMLAWFDAHPRLKDQPLFLQQEGREYEAFYAYLTQELGEEPQIAPDMLSTLLSFARQTK